MQCPKCKNENREGRKFCAKCGAKLGWVCPKCGSENEGDEMFCGECGTGIEDTKKDRETAGEPSPDAERRQITVMFCDLVGSTPLSEKLDPEELREVIHDYQSVCARVIRRFDGHIARYLGDGLLVYFGYPIAHEDDAQRAVRSGLGILEGMNRLNIRLRQRMNIQLQIRLSIHTGIVVAGDIDESQQLESDAIIGETPNIAARLQKLAEPDTLVISSATNRLIAGFFHCRSCGACVMEGISQPMDVYQVLHESGARTRLDIAGPAEQTPLVGREQELGILMARWEQAKERMGHVVLLNGEAGIGKSRVVRVLEERIAEDPKAWLIECRCSPYQQNTALYPVIDLLERVVLQFTLDDTPQEKLSKVEGFLVQYGFVLDEAVPLFASLLSIPLGDSYSPLNMTPQQQKQKTFQSLLSIILARASQQPVLFVVEDLHWTDASSLEFLDLLIDQVPTVPILTLLSFRPGFTPQWTGRSYLTHITLNRLNRKQVVDMVNNIAGKPLPEQIMEQLVMKTDGVPLFVEELTKMVLESGLLKGKDDSYELTGPIPPLAIPTTLHDSLMARLDRLATVKEVAQLGAVIGREFTYELLRTVSMLDEETLQKALAQLIDSEMLYQRGLPPQSMYIFKHNLIQDTAYESLLKSRKQQYHQRIAQALEKQFPDIAETQPQIVAHHYTEAGLTHQAIPYWQKAGQQAVQRSANVEAISHIGKGLELLKDIPETPERMQLELSLQVALGAPLISTKGYSASEVGNAFNRAWDLCQQLGNPPQLVPVLTILTAFYEMRAEYQKARQLGEICLNLAQKIGNTDFLLEANFNCGLVQYFSGEFTESLKYNKQAIALYDPQQHSSHAFIYGQDPGIGATSQIVENLWFLGYPDQSQEKLNDQIRLTKELSHPYNTAYALIFACCHNHLCRDYIATQESAEEGIALCIEHGFPLFLAQSILFRGVALARQGQANEELISQMRQSLDNLQAIGANLCRTVFLSLLVEAYEETGQVDEGLNVLAEAFDFMDKTGDCIFKAELYRLKGELLLMKDEPETKEAEVCYQKAIEASRQQQAKSLELRATMNLSRLYQKQGKVEEARKMLKEIYDWFTEGFGTKDLQEAKALLEELS